VTAAADTVKALTELAEYLHKMSRLGYSKDARDAYADAATRVDQVNIGPGFAAVLAEMDALPPVPTMAEPPVPTCEPPPLYDPHSTDGMGLGSPEAATLNRTWPR
jgi:hypothetical protein